MKIFEYVPFYSPHTGIPRGSYPTADDVLARANMIKDAGLRCTGETWIPGDGNVPIYSGPEITDEKTLLLLCLQKYEDPAIKKTNEIIEEYKSLFEKANGYRPECHRNGSHYLTIEGHDYPIERITEFIEKLSEKVEKMKGKKCVENT